MRKLKKKINRVLSRLNHDFKNYHLFSVRENFQEKFGFKDNLKIKNLRFVFKKNFRIC